jgi:hypothetical protein
MSFIHFVQDPVSNAYAKGTGDDNEGHPLLVFSFALLDKSLPPNSEVAWVKWGEDGESWDYHPNYSLPENAASMIDICPGSLNKLRGLFTLYTIQGQTALRFIGFPGVYGVSPIYDLDAPKGARCLATLRNAKGLTDLVVGAADGLYHITSAQARRHKGAFQVISGGSLNNDPNNLLMPVEQLHLSQTRDVASVLFKNAEGDVGYQEFSTTLNARIQPTPLLSQKSGGGTIAVLLNPMTQCHQVFVLGNNRNLQMLEQNGEKHLWQPAILISYPSLTETVKFTSYTTHVHVTNGNSTLPAINKKLRISSRSEVTLTINGIVKKAGPEGVLATTNAFGDVTIIARSDDMTPPSFSIAEETADGTPSPKTVAVDPAETVKAKIQEIANSEKPEDHQLFKGSKASPEDIQQGVAALKGFSGALYSTSRQAGVESETHTTSASEASVINTELANGETTHETGGGVFQWLSQKLQEIGKIVVQVVEGVWRVVVEWAGKIWNFILNTGAQILKATRWLLEDVLGIPITDIINALGFLFAWDDICDTQDLLMHTINSGIDLLGEGVDLISEGIDDFFEDIRHHINTLIVPEELRDRTHSAKDSLQDEKTSSVMSSPGGNWTNYQIEHGGVTQESSPVSNGIFADDIIKTLDTTVQEVIGAFKTKINVISSRFSEIGDPTSKLSIGSILTLLAGDLADAFLQGTQVLVKGLLRVLKSMLLTIKKAINEPITIPLLSSLYKSMTGQDLTLLGAMSLLLAVPTTLLLKAIFKKKPRDLRGVQAILDEIKAGRAKSNAMANSAPVSLMASVHDDMLRESDVQADMKGSEFATDSRIQNLTAKVSFVPTTNTLANVVFKEGSSSSARSLVVRNVAARASLMHMSVPTRPHIPFWDSLAEYLKKFLESPVAYLKDIVKLGAVAAGAIRTLFLYWKITVPDFTMPIINKTFYFWLILDIVTFIGTCPLLVSGRLPLIGLRVVNWGIGIVNIGFCWLSKTAKAIISLGVGVLQAIMEIVILIEDMSADVKEFPNVPQGAMMITHAISVVSAQFAKISTPIAIRLQGSDGYSLLIAIVSTGLVPIANITTYGLECVSDNPKDVHIISLLGS